MVVHVLPMLTGVFVQARSKLGGNDMEPVVSAPIYEHIIPPLVSNGGLRNVSQKLRLKLMQLSWIPAGFHAIRFYRAANNVATPSRLGDSRSRPLPRLRVIKVSKLVAS